ncbi:MAG: hypothetical protein E6J56_01460 [Deltaproteobacteria bacterium]|nr:MAG: hypothetical protein E6J56_01460 [Deltaproteobacteria bacterium]
MAGLITVGGLATGIDTNSIIDKLVALEKRPVALLGVEVQDVQATQTSINTLGGKLSTLRSAAHALGTTDGVLVRAATSSDTDVLAAAAGAGAQPGSVALTITQLARGSVAGATVGVASATSTVASGPGTFQFQVGSGTVKSVNVDATTTLQGLATAINALDAGVTASAVNLGTASAPDFRLEIASKATGATSTVTVTHDDTALAVQTAQAGQNAQFTVDGFSGTFERESNTFGDVLPGVTVTLRNRGTATVTVADDADAITAKVKTLVAAFNDIVTFVTGESQVTETQDKSDVALGSLATDSTVKHLVARLHEVFSESVGGAYTNLSSLGLATQQDGTIAFDEGKFRTALGSDSTAVAATFAGAGTASGVAKDLSALIDGMTGSGGTLALHTTALNDQIRSLQDQIDAGQREVDAFEVNLRQQFTALETFVSGLKNQGSFLQQAFGR